MEFVEAATSSVCSRSRVDRAGDAIRNGVATDADEEILEKWRAAHGPVLNTFQANLRQRTRGSNIVVAQRHKRKRTIFDKLARFPKMKLSRMNDIVGCRIIFNSVEELNVFRSRFHTAKFDHVLCNKPEQYDYIARPKDSGYRGIHDVFEYRPKSKKNTSHDRLLIEIQYRTYVQHAWATAVELIGFITENQPKFQRGDERYQQIMRICSEIIARTREEKKSCLPDISSEDLIRDFNSLDAEIGFMHFLRSLNEADAAIAECKIAILLYDERRKLEILPFNKKNDALKKLFEIENCMTNKNNDIVLVQAESGADLRIAFRNYFSDAREFISLIECGLNRL